MLLRFVLSLAVLIFTNVSIQALAGTTEKKVKRTVQSVPATEGGVQFKNACLAALVKRPQINAESVCTCIVRNLEASLNIEEIHLLTRDYRGQSPGRVNQAHEIIREFESQTAVECLSNPNVVLPHSR